MGRGGGWSGDVGECGGRGTCLCVGCAKKNSLRALFFKFKS